MWVTAINDVRLQSGVEFIASPAGSVADDICVKAADEHNMTMALTDVRLFHHWY